MRAKLISFAIFAASAFGQAPADATVERVFHFHHIDAKQDLQDVATLVRTIADIRDASVDTVQKSISIRGTDSQIQLAEWMLTELDRTSVPDSVTKEFHVSNNGDDVVRMFYLPNTATVQNFQEVATAVRTVADIRRVFTYNAARAMAVRGTADQIAAVDFMVQELDQPANAKRTDSREYPMIDPQNHGETAVRVFYLPYTSTPQQFQEVATLIRTVEEIRRVYTYNAARALVLRGTPAQVADAAWIAHELGTPVRADKLASSEYRMETSDRNGENIVRVFYLKGVATVPAFQQVATQIRIATQMRRVFTYNATMAMAVRGTANQIALAGQMLQDRYQQTASK